MAYDQDRIVTPVTPSRFSSHFGLRTGGVSYPETLDGSSNSFPEEDEDDDSQPRSDDEEEPVKPTLPPPETGNTLFVRNVPFEATEDDLRTL